MNRCREFIVQIRKLQLLNCGYLRIYEKFKGAKIHRMHIIFRNILNIQNIILSLGNKSPFRFHSVYKNVNFHKHPLSNHYISIMGI